MAASGRLTAIGSETYEAQVAAVRTQLMNALQGLPPNPLRVLAKEEKASDLSEAATVLSEVGCDE
jgi:hypothetical protein